MIMNANYRFRIANALNIIHKKGYLSCEDLVKFYTKLLIVKDKALRKFIKRQAVKAIFKVN